MGFWSFMRDMIVLDWLFGGRKKESFWERSQRESGRRGDNSCDGRSSGGYDYNGCHDYGRRDFDDYHDYGQSDFDDDMDSGMIDDDF